eukprot:761074-Hanusia_phi.AAC.3
MMSPEMQIHSSRVRARGREEGQEGGGRTRQGGMQDRYRGCETRQGGRGGIGCALTPGQQIKAARF